MIPNIVHFNYGLIEQTNDFLFVYYIAVLSCKIINNPNKIYFHCHYEPKGQWWHKTKELVDLIKVDIPTHIGNKELKKVAHKSDILRMKILKQYGGIYLDIDTICIRNYQDLLYNKFVIANEITDSGRNMGLCNAIMMCEPNCSFINDWWTHYEKFFNPDGWQEASTILPYEISKVNKNLTILNPETFLKPSWEKIEMIFECPNEISNELIILHYWNQHSLNKYLNNIKNFDWVLDNGHTLYGKALIKILERINIVCDYNLHERIINNLTYSDFMNKLNDKDYNKINNTNFNKNEAQIHYNQCKQDNIIYGSLFKNDMCVGLPIIRVYHIDFNFSNNIKIKFSLQKINYKILSENKYYHILFSDVTKNFHIQIFEENKEHIIYNLENQKEIIIFPPLKITIPIKNISIKPITIIQDSKFIINTQYISENLAYVTIRRSDCDWGWHQNLYLDVVVNNKAYYYYVGKSMENNISVILKIDEKLEPVNLNYIQKIPKKIFQTWKNHDMGTEMKNTVYSITEKNPEYQYKLFDDDECAEYIKNNFDKDVLDAYNNLIPGAFKADLFRYCILYKEGGIYMDCKMIDEIPFRNFINPEDECILVKDSYQAEITEFNIKGIYNAFMCTIPNNQLLKKAIDKIVFNSINLYYPMNPFVVTGPSLLGVLLQENTINCRFLDHPFIGLHYTNHNNGIFNNGLLIYKTYKNYYKNNNGGNYIQQYNLGQCYKSTIDLLKVYATDEYTKTRIGPNKDGGYVLYDLDKYDGYIGCGIENDCNFEIDLLNSNKHKWLLGYCFDGTINNLPDNFPEIHFTWVKKNISFNNSESTTKLDEYVETINNGLLKMDIEGHEWKWINSLDNKFFNRFSQMIFEFHGLFQNNWQATIQEKIDALKKINETHYLIHIHGNNHERPILNNNILLPTVLEVTYIRKDLIKNIKLNTQVLPSKLDYPCCIHRPDLELNFPPFVNLEIGENWYMGLQYHYEEAYLEINKKPENLSWCPPIAIFPRNYYNKIQELNHNKIYDYVFIGSINSSQKNREWAIEFAINNFTKNSIFINTDDVKWYSIGEFDLTNQKKGYCPKNQTDNQSKNVQYRKIEDNLFYFETMCQAKFCLCPAGDAPWSFRFYEILMCKSIPIVESWHHTYRTVEESTIDYKYYLYNDMKDYDESIIHSNKVIFEKYHLLS